MMTYVDNESRRGKLLTKTIYNSAGQILDQERTDYSYPVLQTVRFEIRIGFGGLEDTCNTFYRPGYDFTIKSNLPVSQNLLTKKTNTSYFNTNTASTIIDYQYDSTLPFVTNEVFNSGLSNIKTERQYPYFLNQLDSQPILSNLITQNKINEVVVEKVYRDNVLLDTKQINYKDFGNGLVLPKSISTSTGAQALEEQSVVDLRDNKGNILQYHDKNGVNTSIIYGYNQAQAIAKIENATYSEVSSFVSNLQSISNTGTESSMITALNNLRNTFPNAMVTTYTYLPLVGISSITDPKGNLTTYTYDSFGRLEFVKDAQGNLISQNQYHYKN
ncbi:hypothetical protein D3C85_1097960 [compost metagenome]